MKAFSYIFSNALADLQSGCLMPWDRQILADSPLPEAAISPYTSQEVPDVLASMRLTFDALSVWIGEAKKTDYFSKNFVKLSKMIMNGVTTMGRGLITLHNRGEDISASPMSIQDLIGVASYHLRKSYLGVLQTVKSDPETSTRLLMNQIGWNNMLMRLFRTKEKLAQKAEIRIQKPETAQIESAASPCLHSPESAADTLSASCDHDSMKTLPASKEQSFSAPSAMTEPGALTAPRAFSSFEKRSSVKIPAAAAEKRTELTDKKAIILPVNEKTGTKNESEKQESEPAILDPAESKANIQKSEMTAAEISETEPENTVEKQMSKPADDPKPSESNSEIKTEPQKPQNTISDFYDPFRSYLASYINSG